MEVELEESSFELEYCQAQNTVLEVKICTFF